MLKNVVNNLKLPILKSLLYNFVHAIIIQASEEVDMKIRKLMYITLLIATFLMLSGCDFFNKDNKIVAICIDEATLIEEYELQDFEISSLKLLMTYKDGKTENINITMDMLSEEDQTKLNMVGSHEITVTYQGLRAKVIINLVDEVTSQLKLIYQLALSETSFSGTYEEWLNSIKGEKGVGIKSAMINTSGHLILTLTDNTTLDAGVVIVKKHLVTFKDYNGYVLDVQLVEEGKSAVAPTIVPQDGRTFLKWSDDFTNVTKDITVTAIYTINKYTITLNRIDGINTETIEVNYGEKLSVKVPERDGYIFEGWYLDNMCLIKFDINTPITKDTILYGKWTESTQFFVLLLGPLEVEVGSVVQYYVLTEPESIRDFVNFGTSDESIATIDQDGLLTALKAGSISIYAEYNHEVAVLNIRVINKDEATIDDLKKADNVSIRFRIPFGVYIQNAIMELMNSFKVKYPNVDITLESYSGYDAMRDQTIYDIQAGRMPTMIVGYPDHFAEYLSSNGMITLDEYIYNEDPEIGYTEEEINDFIPGYLEEVQMFSQEKSFIGLPFNKSTEIMFYNKSFFDQFSLQVPKTWEELEALDTQVKSIIQTNNLSTNWFQKIKNSYNDNEFMSLIYDSGGNLFTSIIHQFGGKYTESVYGYDDKIDLYNGKLSFVTDAKAKEALTYMQLLAHKKVMNLPAVWQGAYGSNFLLEGNVIMNIGSSAGISYYYGADFELGYAPVPYAENKTVIQQGTNVGIMSQASALEKLAAWLFIKHSLEPINTASFAINTGYFPVRKSSLTLSTYQQFLNSGSPIAQIHKVVSETYATDWNYFVDPAWKFSSLVRNFAENGLTSILVYKTDVQTIFNKIKSEYDAYR